MSKDLGVMEEQVLKDGEMVNPKKLMVPCKNGSPTACYQIGYKIGEGSFAVVRVSTHNKTKTKYAIKEIFTGDLTEEQMLDLSKEMNILSQLRHNNIVGIHEVYKTKNHYYLVLEYLSGGELFDAICEQECYNEEDARNVMLHITYAVIHCHRHGFMHRDLKPENLILVSNKTNIDIKLIDFGYATPFGVGIPKETRMVGTPGYIAPEMFLGIPYGPGVDIWSLGVIMYVLLAGTSPFPLDNKEKLVEAIKTGSFSYPPKYWGVVSASAKDLINHMLVVDQDQRYTIEDVLKHRWLRADDSENPEIIKDLSQNLQNLRTWNANRKMVKMQLAMKSCVKFTLAGKRYKAGLLSAAKHARELEKKGIDWNGSSAEEIIQKEKEYANQANNNSV